ncbi:hypothetical protein WSK_0960 [Novosphingobium sp. Rr 2-17]|nr:hypothetical protein WSK_0960 [Novosphingobium sp. Rr 2-17]
MRAAQADAARSHFLRSQGVATLRVPAKVILEDVNVAVMRIVEVCGLRGLGLGSSAVLLRHPADGPPPHAGEDV